MKRLFQLIVLFAFQIPLFCQSFQLPGDGKWYKIASIGGQHGYFKYKYSHSTAHNPSLTTGEFTFINYRNNAVQVHHAMGYNTWNQPQFALITFGDISEIWVKASMNIGPGTFFVTDAMHISLNMGDISDFNLSDNGGSLKIYDKLMDDSHTFGGNLIVTDGQVGIGKNPEGNHKLDVAGTIRASEIKVELASANQFNVEGTLHANNIKVAANGQTADFVFEEGYDLKPIEEVEAFVKENKHLPNIPSANDMEANGVDLAEMNKLLLQKVEELTLYMIELKKENEKLTTRVEKLEK